MTKRAAPSSAFKPGKSGNPGGRPKGFVEMQALAREHTTTAIEALVAALGNQRERVPAAMALLDRGWGKPAQAITGADGGALAAVIEVITGVPRPSDETPDNPD